MAEVSFCYTDNILAPKYEKYSLDYYLKLAKQLEAMGADILCIKDMGGLLRPLAAKKLVTRTSAGDRICPSICTPMTPAATRSLP